MILRVPGDALQLRTARMERDDFRTRLEEVTVSFVNGSEEPSHLPDVEV